MRIAVKIHWQRFELKIEKSRRLLGLFETLVRFLCACVLFAKCPIRGTALALISADFISVGLCFELEIMLDSVCSELAL